MGGVCQTAHSRDEMRRPSLRRMNSTSKAFARLAGLTLIAAIAWALRGQAQSISATRPQVPAPIGVYDSRVIAYAHFWSAPHQRRLSEMAKAAQAAKGDGDGQTARFQELETELKQAQEKVHLQIFSTAPADEALAALRGRLPAIEREAGVATLVSVWDDANLKRFERASRVDLTEQLLQEFKLDTNRLSTARDLRRKQPLPLEKARALIRKGTL
jgi:hypothetical protein